MLRVSFDEMTTGIMWVAVCDEYADQDAPCPTPPRGSTPIPMALNWGSTPLAQAATSPPPPITSLSVAPGGSFKVMAP